MPAELGPLLVIVGPTASGKSALAMDLCRALGGEIISADSMQVYRECDIVTAKPTAEEQLAVPHHLINIVDPTERFSAGQWAEAALDLIQSIRQRGKVPVVCGGTGFYIKALLNPETLAAEAPDEAVRRQVEAETAELSNEAAHALLAEVNPELAEKLHYNDRYRVIRGIEIARSGGAVPVEREPRFDAVCFGIDWPREELYRRIEERVLLMLEAGGLEELRQLTAKWGAEAPALGGVGYKQLKPALEDPSALPACIDEWQKDTRRYAKRQLTWFRNQLAVEWLSSELSREEMVGRVLAGWG